MKKSILEIYALAVCLASIGCFAITLGYAIYDVVEIANPEFTMNSYEYKKYQSNDEYWETIENRHKDKTRPPEEALTKRRLESFQLAIKMERKVGFQSLTWTVIIIIISIIIFFIHWRIARRARETNLTP